MNRWSRNRKYSFLLNQVLRLLNQVLRLLIQVLRQVGQKVMILTE